MEPDCPLTAREAALRGSQHRSDAVYCEASRLEWIVE